MKTKNADTLLGRLDKDLDEVPMRDLGNGRGQTSKDNEDGRNESHPSFFSRERPPFYWELHPKISKQVERIPRGGREVNGRGCQLRLVITVEGTVARIWLAKKTNSKINGRPLTELELQQIRSKVSPKVIFENGSHFTWPQLG